MSENVVLLRKVMLQQALERSGQTMKSFLVKKIEESNSSEEEIRKAVEQMAEATDDIFIEFYARMPKPTFDRTLAAISGRVIPEEKIDPKVRIMNWLTTQHIDVRKFLKEQIADVRRPEDEDLEEFKEFESLLSEGTDEEVRELFVEMIDEESEVAQKMLAMVEFTEAFTNEGDPEELELEQRFADLAVSDAQKKIASKKQFDDMFGPIGKEETLSPKRDTGETEEELIEKLNRLEYRRDESLERFSAVQAVSGTSKGDFDKAIRDTKSRLREMQGGQLDRFGLRNFSADEVKQLIESAQAEIDEITGNNVQTQAALNKLAEHFKAPPGLTDLFAPTSKRYRLYIQKRLSPELKLRLVRASVKGNTPRDRAAQVAAEVQEMNETLTLLEEQCEDQVRRNPSQADAIRRRYRKTIDALKESE